MKINSSATAARRPAFSVDGSAIGGDRSPLETFLDAARAHGLNPEEKRGEWLMRCPAHDDKNPSLAAKTGRVGRLLLKCRSHNCEFKEIMASVGLPMSAAFPDGWKPQRRNSALKLHRKPAESALLAEITESGFYLALPTKRLADHILDDFQSVTFDVALNIAKGKKIAFFSPDDPDAYADAMDVAQKAVAWGAERVHLVRLNGLKTGPGADVEWVARNNLRETILFINPLEADGDMVVHVQPDPETLINEAIDDPHRMARIYLEQKHSHADRCTLVFHDDQFMRWGNGYYHPVPTKEINAEVNRVCKDVLNQENIKAIADWEKRGNKDEDGRTVPMPVVRKVGTRLIGDVSQALISRTIIEQRSAPPRWLTSAPPFEAVNVLPCKNALIHLPSYVEGRDCAVRPATPLYFGTYALDYDFDPDAPEPARWLRFLDQLWGDDPKSIEALQEWFGLCLTEDTSQQKIMTLIGPRRAGKDTIARVLRAMIGVDNVAGPTLASIATNFGLQSLIGRPLAIVSDARLSSRTDQAVIVERLLTISGEGTLTVDRKHLAPWTGKLPTKLMVISNEVPRLYDTSSALSGRLLLLKLTNTFYGNEDTRLFEKLIPELPGILKWAIEGWRRLDDRGAFVQPKSGQELLDDMQENESPVKTFLDDWCELRPELRISRKALFRAWQAWCEQAGRKDSGDAANFGRNLKAAYSRINSSQPRDGQGKKIRVYEGVDLKKEFAEFKSSNDSDF